MDIKLTEYSILSGLAATPLMRIVAEDNPTDPDQIAITSLLGIIYTHMNEEQRNLLLDSIIQRLLAINLRFMNGVDAEHIRKHRKSFELILSGVSEKYLITIARKESA